MTDAEFANLLARFALRPVPPVEGRHVYLWHGSPDTLRSWLRPGLGKELDLYALAQSLPRAPYAADEARRVLQAAIVAFLRQAEPTENAQQVVIVTGNALLMRYGVSLEPFFRVSSESRLVVLVVSPQESTAPSHRPLPLYVTCRPSATFNFLKDRLGERSVIGDLAP